MADVTLISLELDSSQLEAGAKRAENALRGVENAADRLTERGLRKSRQEAERAAREQQRLARESLAFANAMASVDRATGNYANAIAGLQIALKGLDRTSVDYLRTQKRIIDLQNEAAAAARRTANAASGGGVLQTAGALAQLPGLGAAGGAVSRVSNVAGAIESVTSGASGATIALGAMAAGVAAVGAVAVIAAKQIFDFSVEGAKLADELNNMSRVTGLSVGQLSLIKTTAAQSGTNLKEFQSAALTFASKLEEAATGKLPRLAGALRAFGIDAKKGIEEPEKAVLQFGKALTTVEDPILRVSLAREGLGRSGASLIPLFDALAASTETTGRVTEQMARAAGALDNALAEVSDRADDAKISIAAVTAPSIIAGIDAVAVAFQGVSAAIETISGQRGLNTLATIALFLAQARPGAVGDALLSSAGPRAGRAPRRFSDTPSRSTFFNANQVSDFVRKLQQEEEDKTNKPRGGGREKIDAVTQGLLTFIEVADRLARQSVPQLVDTIVGAQDDVALLSQKLSILSAAGYDTAQTTEQLARAQETLRQAQEKFFKSTGDALTEQLRKVGLVPQTGVPLIGAEIPGVGGTTNLAFQKGIAGIIADVQRRFREGSGGSQQFNGPIPGQFDAGTAPDPYGGRLVGLRQQFFGRTTGTGERIQGAGEFITQEFIRGALLGRPDAARAGEDVAFFFADYASRKLTEELAKSLDTAFDFLGELIGRLLNSIGSKIGGSVGNIIGTIAGSLFGGGVSAGAGAAGGIGDFFLAGGGGVSAGQIGIVGEHGREWFVPRSNGFIVNQQQAAAAVGGGGGGATYVTMHFNVSTPTGKVERRSIDQMSEQTLFAVGRAQRLRGA